MNYNKTIEYLYEQLPMFSKHGKNAIKKGLHNIELLCAYLGNPHQKFRSIHIAGTNGKGSTSHMLAAIFQAQGYNTGLYTSPHLIDFRERIRHNGKMASKNYVTSFVRNHKAIIEKIQPSFFEITVAMAFDYFAKKNVDIAIIETGLGGRLDSTNIIRPQLSVITNISFDHKDMLGDTLATIATEKAGIIKENTPVVIGRKEPETDAIFIDTANLKNAPLYFAQEVYDDNNFILNNKYKYLIYLIDYNIYIKNNFYSDYQYENIKTVLATIEIWNKSDILPITFHAIKTGIEEVHALTGLSGRWQILQEKPLLIVDVAHNEDGLKSVFENIKNYTYQSLWIIYGTLRDKDIKAILPILPLEAEYILTQPNTPRKMDIDTLSSYFSPSCYSYKTFPCPSSALRYALSTATDKDIILITGSFYIVNEILEIYQAKT